MIDYDKVLEDVFNDKLDWMIRIAVHHIRDRIGMADINNATACCLAYNRIYELHHIAQQRLNIPSITRRLQCPRKT